MVPLALTSQSAGVGLEPGGKAGLWMVEVHWGSSPRSQMNSETGGFTSTGEEWKMSPSFQNSGTVR